MQNKYRHQGVPPFAWEKAIKPDLTLVAEPVGSAAEPPALPAGSAHNGSVVTKSLMRCHCASATTCASTAGSTVPRWSTRLTSSTKRTMACKLTAVIMIIGNGFPFNEAPAVEAYVKEPAGLRLMTPLRGQRIGEALVLGPHGRGG